MGDVITEFDCGSTPLPRCEGVSRWGLRLLAPFVAALENGDEWRLSVGGGKTNVGGLVRKKTEVIHEGSVNFILFYSLSPSFSFLFLPLALCPSPLVKINGLCCSHIRPHFMGQ